MMTTTRWVTPEGARIELTHGTLSSHHDGRGRVSGASWDGWVLIVRHPRSLQVISETHLGAEVPEAELRAALDAVGAVPVLGKRWPPRPPAPAWVAEAGEAGRRGAERWAEDRVVA